MVFKVGDIVRNKLKSKDQLFEIRSIDKLNKNAIMATCNTLNPDGTKIIKTKNSYNNRDSTTTYEKVLIRQKNLEHVRVGL